MQILRPTEQWIARLMNGEFSDGMRRSSGGCEGGTCRRSESGGEYGLGQPRGEYKGRLSGIFKDHTEGYGHSRDGLARSNGMTNESWLLFIRSLCIGSALYFLFLPFPEFEVTKYYSSFWKFYENRSRHEYRV